ncbi:MAG: hypothetical protein LW878_08895, partial [Proteobacteria bacterium]|nr:hypothetical protein [Pseudomonadota bacterium]
MKTGVIALLLFGVFNCWSQVKLTCSKKSLKIAYINGINTDDDKARVGASRLSAVLSGSLIDEKGIDVSKIENFYNHSSSLGSDLIEATYQKLRALLENDEQGKSLADLLLTALFYNQKDFFRLARIAGVDVSSFVSEAEKIYLPKSFNQDQSNFLRGLSAEAVSGDKVLVLAHSQGTLFAKKLIDQLAVLPEKNVLKRNVVGGIYLAPAESFLPKNSIGEPMVEYIKFENDLVIKLASQFSSNMKITNGYAYRNEDWMGHGLTEIYLNPSIQASVEGTIASMPEHLLSKVKKVLSRYVSNDERCCKLGSRGYFWGDSRCNEGSCLGGFVESKVKVLNDNSLNISIDKDSVVCDGSQIDPKEGEIKLTSSSIINPTLIEGNVEIKNIEISKSSDALSRSVGKISGDVFIDGGIGATRSKIIGAPQIQDIVTIQTNTPQNLIKGSPVISGNVTLTNTIIEEVYPSQKEDRRSQINLISFGGMIDVEDSNLKGAITLNEATKFKNVSVDGKLWARKVTAETVTIQNDYLENPDRRGALLDSFTCPNSLEIINSQIGGDPKIDACGSIKSESVIFGNVDILGKVQIDKSYVLAEPWVQDEVAMKITGSDTFGIRIENESFLYNRPTIEGDLFIQGAEFNGNGSYKGLSQTPVPGTVLRSRLLNARFSTSADGTQNDISGFYNISADVAGSKIEGGYIAPESGFPFRLLTIYPSAQLGEKLDVKGVGDISGTIGSLVKIDGYKVAPGFSGVNVTYDSSFVGAGKSLKGAVVIYDESSVVNTNMTGSGFNPSNNGIMAVDASTVNNSNLSG